MNSIQMFALYVQQKHKIISPTQSMTGANWSITGTNKNVSEIRFPSFVRRSQSFQWRSLDSVQWTQYFCYLTLIFWFLVKNIPWKMEIWFECRKSCGISDEQTLSMLPKNVQYSTTKFFLRIFGTFLRKQQKIFVWLVFPRCWQVLLSLKKEI